MSGTVNGEECVIFGSGAGAVMVWKSGFYAALQGLQP